MDETPFVSLAELIRSRPPVDASPPPAPAIPAPRPPAPSDDRPVAAPQPAVTIGTDTASAIRDARRFRSALADALEAVHARLVAELARDVLGRELRLAPADLAAIARRLLVERHADTPLRLLVAPADADLQCDVPVCVDAELAPGDAVLVCTTGTIDARLAVRLATVVALVTA